VRRCVYCDATDILLTDLDFAGMEAAAYLDGKGTQLLLGGCIYNPYTGSWQPGRWAFRTAPAGTGAMSTPRDTPIRSTGTGAACILIPSPRLRRPSTAPRPPTTPNFGGDNG